MKTMTPEERFERIERQLEFSAGILAQLSASQERQDAEIAQLAEALSTLVRVVDEQGNRMEAGFKRMEERQAQTDEQMKHTDERLNALVAVVERYFSNGHH